MGKNFTYVDNSNLFIEGRRTSAVAKGLPGAENIYSAMRNRIVDMSWDLDYGALHSFACGDLATIGGVHLWGSPPPSDSFWDMVRRFGFNVTTYDKNAAGKEKKVDVAIAHKITKDSYGGLIQRGTDEITLIAGDKDFVPVIEDLVSEGFIVDLVFWDHAAQELKDAATNFVSLNPHLSLLTKRWQA